MTNTDSTTITRPAVPLVPGRWTLDAAHSTVTFWIRHLGVSKVRGRFDRFDATLDVGTTVDDVRVAATIDVDSVDTGNRDRDVHLRSADYLDVDRHPQMTFLSTAIAGGGTDWTMDGELTIKGTARPVSLAVDFGGVETYFGAPHAGFAAEGRIERQAFGLEFAVPPGVPGFVLGDVVHLQLDLQFVAPDGAAD
jgi:polyisoprenoid-binding protein YceI